MKRWVFGLAVGSIGMSVHISAAAEWSGPFVGVQAGIVNMTGVEDFHPDFWLPQHDPYVSWNGLGGSVGAFVGYDIELAGQFVIGVSGEVNLSNASALEWPIYDGWDYRVHHNWDASIQARAGALVSPDVLVYALLGYGWGGFDAAQYWVDVAMLDDATWTGRGTKIGTGVEVAVSESVSLRGEVAATFYNTQDLDIGPPYWQITPTVYTARAGLSWGF